MNSLTVGRRWRAVALLAIGLAFGVALSATPAAGHVGGTVEHLWGHLKPKADARYYTKANANARYFTKAQADARYLPAAAADSERITLGSSTDGTVLEVMGNRLWATCGTDGGSILYRNLTGFPARLMRANVVVTVNDQTNHELAFGAAITTPLTMTFQVAWGSGIQNMTTFTVHWTAAGGSCEILAQAVTSD